MKGVIATLLLLGAIWAGGNAAADPDFNLILALLTGLFAGAFTSLAVPRD